MTGLVFVDTNVFVYDADATDPAKQQKARRWLSELWRSRSGRLSIQVLNELYVVVTRKLKPGLPRNEARALVRQLRAWEPLALGDDIVERAFGIEDRHAVSWWDALIVAAAQAQSCGFILSEDLQAGQSFDGVVVVDPFTSEPADLERPVRAHDGP